ncbi:DUF4405 domain-containing protein [Rhodovulum sulfidophilum]|uniref:DUF4405 domain-containing protein n=1 Tax=Rhodovulum visakhapatnamense TaxID=364297 RepID=A0A4R8G124_9RHOB|nr:DUF4405 domain-containing protein [Rhodovulum visakhapatnamense]MBL3568592.1 DUF4405 domain-containing protein [Rhodovulum visakhapatnamense]MBL3580759.1 DUF4405 domain-containing protein [Rhodovulum visakhapatnamense]OLS43841.1 DUF4405 domain-containing protein [Rhodovulum sulfidophilum]TDX33215.1 hypothetical protein EV657_10290 [Rhodovulum visakhapatnamense]
MRSLLMRYATPSIIGLFLVSLVTGTALFFHVGPSAFHGIHEWLSMVLILGFALHVWRNWRPMLAYMKGKPLAVSLVVSLLLSAVFFLPGRSEGGPPVFGLAAQVMAHSATEVAPALGTTPDALIARLTAAGYTVGGPDQPLAEIASASGRSTMDLAATLIGSAR